MKIEKKFWFAGSSLTVGVVVGVDETTGKKKAYVGQCLGNDEEYDAAWIASTGAAFPAEAAREIAEALE